MALFDCKKIYLKDSKTNLYKGNDKKTETVFPLNTNERYLNDIFLGTRIILLLQVFLYRPTFLIIQRTILKKTIFILYYKNDQIILMLSYKNELFIFFISYKNELVFFLQNLVLYLISFTYTTKKFQQFILYLQTTHFSGD